MRMLIFAAALAVLARSPALALGQAGGHSGTPPGTFDKANHPTDKPEKPRRDPQSDHRSCTALNPMECDRHGR